MSVAEVSAWFRRVVDGRGAKKCFGELAQDWLSRVARQRVCPDNERRHVRHLSPLWGLREGTLTKAAIEECLGRLAVGRESGAKLGPATLNKLRSTGRLVIRDAQGNGLWRGPNPFDLVRRYRVPKPVHPTLTREEARRVLRHLRPDRRRLVHAVVLMAFRKGEALGMLKTDVDLRGRVLTVRRSHGRAQTKTGREREVPIPRELLEEFRRALAGPGPYVFPNADGTRQRADTKLTRMLRAALRRAGIEKRLRFHDLRHAAATLHLKAGCDPLVVRLLLGHASKSVTDDYIHLDVDYQRRQLAKLSLAHR